MAQVGPLAPPLSSSRRHTLQVLVAVAFFTGVTIVFTWPVAAQPDKLLAGSPGDSLYGAWVIAWVQKAVLELHQSPLSSTVINYPEGWSLATTEMMPAMVVVALPVSYWFGPIAGFNFAALTSFILSGLVVFVYVRRWTGNWIAALFAGTAFAFSPFRMTHYLVGHLNLLGTHWPALYLLSIYEVVAVRKAGWASLALPALALTLTALTSQYFLYMALLLTVPMVIAAVPWRNGIVVIRRALASVAIAGVVALPLLVLAEIPYLVQMLAAGLPNRSLSYLRMYSASPTDYLLPPTFGLVFGGWVGDNFDRDLWVEATLYVGLVCLLVVCLGFMRKEERRERNGLTGPWITLMVFAFTLSLGTDLHWLSTAVQIRVPEALRSVHPGELAYVPLPGRLALAWLPYYGAMRVWMRYGVFVSLALSLLAGLALDRLLHARGGRASLAVGGLAILGLLLDFAPRRLDYFEVRAEPIDYWLQEQEGPGAVVELPYGEINQYQFYRSTVYDKPLVGWMYTTSESPLYQRVAPVLGGFPDQASVGLLAELGVGYAVVDTSKYEDYLDVNARILALGLELGACRAEKCAYIVPGGK
jgi:hypothetical protein